MQTLIIDNYDSYTYNLYQLVWRITGVEPIVIKNDEMDYRGLEALSYDNIIISPGPGNPENPLDFGLCREVLEKAPCPILGVCLGHQGLAHLYGSHIIKAPKPVHGYTSKVYHDGSGIFKDIPSPFSVMRYHSLIVDEVHAPLRVTGQTEDGIIMGLCHEEKPLYGVQFHPESIASEYGEQIIRNFMAITDNNHAGIVFRKQPWEADSEALFNRLYAMEKELLWLDSSRTLGEDERYSIFGLRGPRSYDITYDVEEKIVRKTWRTADGEVQKESYQESFFTYFDRLLKTYPKVEGPVPFSLGFIGYLGYEVKSDNGVNNRFQSSLPDAYWRFVDRAVVYDHLQREIYLISYIDDQFELPKEEAIFAIAHSAGEAVPNCYLEMSKEQYQAAINECVKQIYLGESYEICITNRIHLDDMPEPVTYYKQLRNISPGQYSALLLLPGINVASSSMERFLRIRDRKMTAKPIKGTLPRGRDPKEDEVLYQELKHNPHYHAENLMIVDLLRNDLGRVAKAGSVSVPKLLDVESYSTLFQLVSTIEGSMKANVSIVDVLKAIFPGGSMTGAPKKRTLEIIDELELSSRGIYSGTIGYMSLSGDADFSIVIRTAVMAEGKTTIGVGGAIIATADAEDEFDEILVKAKGALKALAVYYGVDSIDINGVD